MYIADQEKRHRTQTFQDEYLAWVREYEVPYNEEHIWG
jgi:hypothetical protein